MDNCKDEHMLEDAVKAEDLGKFESVEALLGAYENLEREFTRKSQKLAELEKYGKSDNCNETGSEQPEAEEEEWTGERTAASRNEREALGASPTISSSDSTANEQIEVLTEEYKPKLQELSEEELIEIALQSERIRDNIISDYLQSLAANNGVRILNGRIGAVPLTPPERPRTLKEAKEIADKMMRG